MSKEKPSKPAYALDIFDVLNHVNMNDFEYYGKLEEHEQKALHPLVLMKWMLGTNSDKQILRMNTRVNPYVFSLGQHKELLYKLLCSTTMGKSQRYSWIKTASAKKVGSLATAVVEEFYKCSPREAKAAMELLSGEEVLEMAEYLGRQSDELTKIKAEFKSKTKGK